MPGGLDRQQPRFRGLVSLRIIPPMFFLTSNIIFIHERGTLFHVCVDPGVVPGGLSVRRLRPSLWMERSLSIFSELRVGGTSARRLNLEPGFVADH